MASYKITRTLSGGIYYSSVNNLQGAFTGTGSRYQKDWTLNARYDFNTSTQAYNMARLSFPTVLYAGLLGFKDKPFFKADAASQSPTQTTP